MIAAKGFLKKDFAAIFFFKRFFSIFFYLEIYADNDVAIFPGLVTAKANKPQDKEIEKFDGKTIHIGGHS